MDEKLIAAGYLRYPHNYSDGSKKCNTDLFQKCIRNEYGKKYFININRWDFSLIHPRYSGEVRYGATVQFTKKNGDAINVDYLSVQSDNLKEVEKFYEDMWDTGWFDYYERD